MALIFTPKFAYLFYFFSGGISDYIYSFSDFIQLLVVLSALFGPMIFEKWKKSQDRASIFLIDYSPKKTNGKYRYDPYAEDVKFKISNRSSVVLKNCKVLLKEITHFDDDIPRESIDKLARMPIYRYLPWASLNALAVTLNPSEPSTFLLRKLSTVQYLINGDFNPNEQKFKISYYSDGGSSSETSRIINQNTMFHILIFSENADVFELKVLILWPKNVRSFEEFVDQFQIQVYPS